MAVATVYPIKDATIANHSYWNWYIYQDGTRNSAQIGFWDWDDKPWSGFYAYQARTLQQYNLPILPVGATIISAKLKAYMWSGDNPGTWNSHLTVEQNPTLEVRRILQEWDEGTGTGFTDGHQYSGATWSNRTRYGYGWSASGGYIDGTPAAVKQQARNSGWWEFDVKSLVDYWYANPNQNFGLMLKYQNDNTPKGGMWMQTREDGAKSLGPMLEITYNTPPEKPRGMSPNFGSFICQDLAHTMHFKWNFIDVAAPPALGKADLVFVVDTCSSQHYRLSHIRNQISRYIDRMVAEQVDWNVGLVAYGSVANGHTVRKYGMYSTKNDVLNAFDSMPRYNYYGYMRSGLEGVTEGLTFPFRANSKVQFMICTDVAMNNRTGMDGYNANTSVYEMSEVIAVLNTRGIPTSVSTNTHCGSYTQLRAFPNGTTGLYLEESNNWGDYMKIMSIKSEDEAAKYDEGDYQTKADIRIWKIETNGVRTLVFTHTVNGSIQDVSLKGLGAPWEEGASYEWDVITYDKYGVASPPSDRAKFTYIIDVNALIGVPMFLEPVTIGNTINKKALIEIRTKLYDEVRKYRNMDPGEVLTLFTGEVVPSRTDMVRLRDIMNRMLVGDGMAPIGTDLVGDTFGVSDILAIRDALARVAVSPPDQPAGGTAQWTAGGVHRPISIVSGNSSAVDTTLDVKWTPAEVRYGGWVVDLGPSNDTDINYYKFYVEEVINYQIRRELLLSEVYIKSEQVIDGTIFVPYTGRVDGMSMWYTSHDMNGRSAPNRAAVTIAGNATDRSTAVSHYVVEYQQKFWTAERPDPMGAWYQVYVGGATSFTHTVSAEGSYWYRVKAVLSDGSSTDWTYSVDNTYIKY